MNTNRVGLLYLLIFETKLQLRVSLGEGTDKYFLKVLLLTMIITTTGATKAHMKLFSTASQQLQR